MTPNPTTSGKQRSSEERSPTWRDELARGRLTDELDRAVAQQMNRRVTCAVPGESWLDVGCGAGSTTFLLEQDVGPQGSTVGIDNNPEQIQQATWRGAQSRSTARFEVADAYCLPFAESEFDGCCAHCVFQHLQHPDRALAEMIRVTRPGGWLCVSDPDWDTLTVDGGAHGVTRTIAHYLCDGFQHGRSGRELARRFQQAGLMEVVVIPGTLILRSFSLANELLGIGAALQELLNLNLLTARDADRWLTAVRDAEHQGEFFCSMTGFTACGRKRALHPSGDECAERRLNRASPADGADHGTAIFSRNFRWEGFRWAPWLTSRAVLNRKGNRHDTTN